ncbi:MAG: hypothetical protein MJ109_07215 [Kiritimatiellae bacterium]|nr:hypothetical protein [Kiritimatiellia bacterium]
MTRNERFARSMHSLDLKEQGIDLERSTLRSDQGLGVRRLVEAIDYTPDIAAAEAKAEAELKRERYQKTLDFIAALIAAGKGFAAPTFLKIVKNISDRQQSIEEIMKRNKLNYDSARCLYNKHRETLLNFILCTPTP